MKIMMNLKISACLAIVFMASTVSAQEVRQHGAHAHGIGELNIVVEGNGLLIELISPSANIVGFEHSPNSADEIETVKQAQADLHQANTLFTLSVEAQCRIEHVETESDLIKEHEVSDSDEAHEEHEVKEEGEEHEAHEEHEANEADEEHEAHEEHAESEADEEHEAHEEHEESEADEEHDHDEIHSEFHVVYEFHCDDIEKLTTIDVNVFTVFPLTESLIVQLLSTSGQKQKTLNKNETQLRL